PALVERASIALGERDAQVVFSLSAMWYGCRFCSVGHMLAANLVHLRDTGLLFPIDEADVLVLRQQTDAEMRAWLAERLSAAELVVLQRRLERLSALSDGAKPVSAEDDAIAAALALWAVITECSVLFELPVERIPPLSAIAKDKALLDRYRKMRGR